MNRVMCKVHIVLSRELGSLMRFSWVSSGYRRLLYPKDLCSALLEVIVKHKDSTTETLIALPIITGILKCEEGKTDYKS